MRRNRAFDVVDAFEQELAAYCGAPFAVTVDSCTNAIFLALKWQQEEWRRLAPAPTGAAVVFLKPEVLLPKRTYVGVVQAAWNAGFAIGWRDMKWKGAYPLDPTTVIDSAKRFERGMYRNGSLTCLSFQAGKILPIGRGGAILTDNAEAAEWLRRARLDGRTAGRDYADNTYQREGFHCYMTPPDAARGLWLLTYADDGPDDTWESYPDLSEATWK